MTKGLRVESSAATRTERITAVIGLKYSSQLHDWAGVSRVLTGHEVILPNNRSCITGVLAAAVRTEMLLEQHHQCQPLKPVVDDGFCMQIISVGKVVTGQYWNPARDKEMNCSSPDSQCACEGGTQPKTSGNEELSMAHCIVYGAFLISFTIVRIPLQSVRSDG